MTTISSEGYEIYGLLADEITEGREEFVGPLAYRRGDVYPGEIATLQVYWARIKQRGLGAEKEAVEMAKRLSLSFRQIPSGSMKGCALILLDELVLVDRDFWARGEKTAQVALLGEEKQLYPVPHDFRSWSFREIGSGAREAAGYLVGALLDEVNLNQKEGCLENWWRSLGEEDRRVWHGHPAVWTSLIWRSPLSGKEADYWPQAFENLEAWVRLMSLVYQYLVEEKIIVGELV